MTFKSAATFLLLSFVSSAQLPINYHDRAPQAGVSFDHRASPTREKYLIETMGAGCAFLDYDQDGFLDIFLTNGASLHEMGREGQDPRKSSPQYFNRLYRNLDGKQFVDVTQTAGVQGRGYSMGAAVADYDNDGFPDLYVTGYGFNTLYRNNGDGTFSDITDQAGVAASEWSSSAGFFDYDRDGDLDLFVARYINWSFETNKYCTDLLKGLSLDVDRIQHQIQTGSRNRSYCHPSNYQGLTDLLFRNKGDGTFEEVSEEAGINRPGSGLGVAFGDYDRDGWPDVYVANDAMDSFLYRNKGNGHFEEVALLSGVAYDADGSAVAGMGTDFGDFNNDGWPDLIVTDLSYENYLLFENSGKKYFSEVSLERGVGTVTFMLSGWGVKWVDLDSDGWKDLFLANSHVMDNIHETSPRLSYRQAPVILHNRKGTFVDISEQSGSALKTPLAARGAAFGDVDNDGDIDVLINSINDRARLFYNEARQTNSWLLVHLEGRRSNRDGIGAQVAITVAGTKYWGEVSRAGSYLSSHDVRLHFGLGPVQQVDQLEIRWPSGTIQTLKGVSANQILRVQEDPSDQQ
ncbi:CRTAC1 family protein [Acidobacteria bacterium AH-259-D05]|nr:CRTAC1 family protein [Acidobacteria bacterium AH-259-D05]